ncbi:uncharacterized protein JCM10292_003270 [Rhodotorula paludigena]|uniref:Uncharacterized protein n=1 Tax=Rhodotorula paludigena TaxID=86838 RepID=A0AAV5GHG3_9BASI|nr:hypothetical protein Rhopal_002304-T1 [Rhodotorula paludigena]
MAQKQFVLMLDMMGDPEGYSAGLRALNEGGIKYVQTRAIPPVMEGRMTAEQVEEVKAKAGKAVLRFDLSEIDPDVWYRTA